MWTKHKQVVQQLSKAGYSSTSRISPARKPMLSPMANLAGVWVEGFMKSKLPIAIAAAGGFLIANYAATEGYKYFYKSSILKTLEHGLLPAPTPPPSLPRTALLEEIKGAMRPEKPSRFFSIISGDHGSGKTTLVREACHGIGGGVGYFDVNPAFEIDFGQDLGEAFNFSYEKHVNLINLVSQSLLGRKVVDKGNQHKLSTLRQSAEALRDAAAEFKKEFGKPFVLVFDSTDRLCEDEEGKTALEALVEYAKEWAQDGVISVVFVVSSPQLINKLTGTRPTTSRAAAPIHVPPLTPEETMQYLLHLQVPSKNAAKLLPLVEGSLLLSERAAGMINGGFGADVATVQKRLLDLVELEYQNAGLLDATPHREYGITVIEALLKSSSSRITAEEWRRMVPKQEYRDALLIGGVLCSDGQGVGFTSRLAMLYASERLKK